MELMLFLANMWKEVQNRQSLPASLSLNLYLFLHRPLLFPRRAKRNDNARVLR